MTDLIKLRFDGVKTVRDAQQAWQDLDDYVSGFKFVLASSEPSRFRFPARTNLPGNGFLRSVFSQDHLHFLPNGLASSLPKPTYSISFDLNTASYLRSLSGGRSSLSVRNLVTAISALGGVFGDVGFRWDYFPYLMERADDLAQGHDLNFIYETVLACERLAACDLARVRQDGSLASLVDETALQRKAQSQIESWQNGLRDGMGDQIRHRLNPFYVFVLKAAIIHLKQPKQNAASAKLEELLEFLGNQLKCLPQLAATAALELFTKGSGFTPFAKVASRKPDLKKDAKNVAWDFLHLQVGHKLTGFHGPDGAFVVRYFLTFDPGLRDLFDAFPHRSCLIRPQSKFPWFFADFNYPSQVLDRFPELGNVMAQHFTSGADEQRGEMLQANPPDVPKMIAQLEAEIDQLDK